MAAGPARSVASGSGGAGSAEGLSAGRASTPRILVVAARGAPGWRLYPARPMDRPLRVGLNLAYLVRRSGGAGTYARELIPELLRAGARLTAFVSREVDPEDRRTPWGQE